MERWEKLRNEGHSLRCDLHSHSVFSDGTLTPGFPLGVSNHFTGCSSTIEVTEGSLLVMWDRANGFPIRD